MSNVFSKRIGVVLAKNLTDVCAGNQDAIGNPDPYIVVRIGVTRPYEVLTAPVAHPDLPLVPPTHPKVAR